MKKILLVILILISQLSTVFGVTYNTQFVLLQNDGTTYKVKLQVNTDTGTDGVGTYSFAVTHSTDILFSTSPTAGDDYQFLSGFGEVPYVGVSVTRSSDTRITIGAEMVIDDGGIVVAQSGSGWTDVIELTFSISEQNGSSNLAMLASSTEIFDDDLVVPPATVPEWEQGDLDGLDSSPLPVELTNFTVSNSDADVNLNWETATEVDNYGFEIERAINIDEKVWENIGFVSGYGNSNSPKEYSYVDNSPIGGNKFVYRLKQIDNDGTYTYSDAVEVEVIPNRYELYQNYPNPFNPSTTIRFSLRETQDVKIVIYDQLGQEVRTIVNQKYDAGYHEFEFNASGIASGVYFYRIIAGDFVNIKKMMLLK